MSVAAPTVRAAGVLSALLLAPLAAGAQPARPAGEPPLAADGAAQPSNRDTARALYEDGLRLAERTEWAEAYAKFVRAQELYPAPSNLFNIGQCQRALGRYVGALATFRAFLAAAEGPESGELRAVAEGYVTELSGRVARVRVRAVPADAEVAVDGQPARGEIVLDPGRHTVRVERAGYTTRFIDRDIRPGEIATLEVELERLPAKLRVRANVRGAAVLVDGVEVGKAPWTGERAAGTYRVEIRAPGYATYESRLRVAAGQQGDIDGKLVAEKSSIASRWWFWALVGTAVAGVAVTTYAVTRDPAPADYDGGSLGWVVKK